MWRIRVRPCAIGGMVAVFAPIVAHAQPVYRLIVDVPNHHILAASACTIDSSAVSVPDAMGDASTPPPGHPAWWQPLQWTPIDAQTVIGHSGGANIMLTTNYNECLATLGGLVTRGFVVN